MNCLEQKGLGDVRNRRRAISNAKLESYGGANEE